MPLCPQITITPVTVTSSNMTVTSVIGGGVPATVETVNTVAGDASTALATANTALANAAAAQSSASTAYATAVAANTAASVAQSTADGKNKVTYSTSTPGSTANTAGDIWFQYGTTSPNVGRIIAQYTGNGGTSWTQTTISGLVIANIDAGNITTGTLTAAVGISNPSGKFTVNGATGVMTCTDAIVQGTVVATTGSFTGAVYASSGTFTGTITSATINGGTIAIGSGNSIFKADSNGIYLGNATFASAPFRVTPAGDLTATSGTVGGFTLSSNSLTSTNLGLYTSAGNSITAAGSIISNSEMRSPSFIGNNDVTVEATNNLYLKCGSSYNTYGNSQMYNNSITGRTLLIQGSGTYTLATSSSTRRDKQDIETSDLDVSTLYTLPVQKFRYKREVEAEGQAAPFHHGLMAEDVAAAGGLEWLIDRDEEGQPSYIYWSERAPQALLKMIQEQHQQIEELKARVAALESK